MSSVGSRLTCLIFVLAWSSTFSAATCPCEPWSEPVAPEWRTVGDYTINWHISNPVLAYDSDREVVVMFGDQGFRSGTYEFDGENWFERAALSSDSYLGGLAYDNERKIMVRFGGTDGQVALDETWEYGDNGIYHQWTQALPTVAPPACSRPSLAYDPLRRVVVARGGSDGVGDAACSMAQQTWEYDGVTWRRVDTATQPPDAEPGSPQPPLVWDERGSRLLYLLDREVWAYDGNDWSLVEAFDCEIVGAGFDPQRGSVVFTAKPLPGEPRRFDTTWEWDGESCPRSVAHDDHPSSHGDSGLVYFPPHGSLLRFVGGIFSTGHTWEYLLDRDEDGVADAVDCAPSNPDVHPGATQICDGVNNNCAHPNWPRLEQTTEFDDDGDGFAECQGDCNDTFDDVSPAAVETCNVRDDDCNGLVDDAAFCVPVCKAPQVVDSVPLSSGAGSAEYPSMAWTGSGYGVVWSDDRHGNTEIYFTLTDEVGRPSGGEIRVSDDPAASEQPVIEWTGSGFGVLWWDYRDDMRGELYFALLDAKGNKQVERPLTLPDPSNDSLYHRGYALDWSGTEFGIVWVDRYWVVPTELVHLVYFARIDERGRHLGEPQRLLERFDLEYPKDPWVAWTGKEYVVLFEAAPYYFFDPSQLKFASFDAAGAPLVPLTAVQEPAADVRDARAVWTGDEIAVVWTDEREQNADLYSTYFMKLDTGGFSVDGEQRVETFQGRGPTSYRLAWTGAEIGATWNLDGRHSFNRLDREGQWLGAPLDIGPAEPGRGLIWNGIGFDALSGDGAVSLTRIGCEQGAGDPGATSEVP